MGIGGPGQEPVAENRLGEALTRRTMSSSAGTFRGTLQASRREETRHSCCVPRGRQPLSGAGEPRRRRLSRRRSVRTSGLLVPRPGRCSRPRDCASGTRPRGEHRWRPARHRCAARRPHVPRMGTALQCPTARPAAPPAASEPKPEPQVRRGERTAAHSEAAPLAQGHRDADSTGCQSARQSGAWMATPGCWWSLPYA